nr:hypothetical protein [Tanacetum cinerariifolium]
AQEKQTYEQLIRLMAHEVNNSIGAVNSLLGSFRHYAPQLASADQIDFAQALEVSIARNTQLADFVASYARLVRLPPPAPHPTDLHALLRDLGHLLAPQSAAQGVAWHWELAQAGPLSEVSQQLFTPFFSTKAGGQGIGLTLTTAPPAAAPAALGGEPPGPVPLLGRRCRGSRLPIARPPRGPASQEAPGQPSPGPAYCLCQSAQNECLR